MTERKETALHCLLVFSPLLAGTIAMITFKADASQNAAFFVALLWYVLLERKGYLALGLALFLVAATLFLLISDVSLAFLLAIGLLAFPAILLPGRYELKEIWVLSSGGTGAFQYNFKKEE